MWLSFLPEKLGNMCIAIIFFPGCDVINFEISFIFLMKLLIFMTKNQDKSLNSLRTKKAFTVK